MPTRMITFACGVDLVVLSDESGYWNGIVSIRINGHELAIPALPWLPVVIGPDGCDLGPWRLASVLPCGEAMFLTLLGRGDHQCELELRPVQRDIGGLQASGFSYRWHGYGARLVEECAWTPGGPASEVRLVQRQTAETPDENRDAARSFQTELQGFTVLSSGHGTLITWATRLAHLYTHMVTRDGHLVVRHEHRVSPGQASETAPLEVLWVPGALTPEATYDLHERMRELVSATLHAELSLRPARIRSHGWISDWSDLERCCARGLSQLVAAGITTCSLPSPVVPAARTAVLARGCEILSPPGPIQHEGVTLANDDAGVFGIHRQTTGIGPTVATMPLWGDCLATFDAAAAQRAGHDPELVFFAGCAHRVVWSLCWDPRLDHVVHHGADPVTAFQRSIIAAFNEVEPFMYNRHLLAHGHGVMYRQGRVRIVWAMANHAVDLECVCQVSDLITGLTHSTARLVAQRLHIYRITS